jgi:ferredoxin
VLVRDRGHAASVPAGWRGPIEELGYSFPPRVCLRGPAAPEPPRMPHIITEPCIGTKDASCVAVCPVDCIHPTKNEPDFATATQLFIDPDTCIDCALCVDECPVKAIFQQEDVPSEWNKYVQVNLDYYKSKG